MHEEHERAKSSSFAGMASAGQAHLTRGQRAGGKTKENVNDHFLTCSSQAKRRGHAGQTQRDIGGHASLHDVVTILGGRLV